jgi:hypothetical protein
MTPGLFEDSAKAESALAKIGDGKFKTNALRFPTSIESLESYLQSIARKMNIRITKRSPHWGKNSKRIPYPNTLPILTYRSVFVSQAKYADLNLWNA